jgi:uncharacterized protein (DUF1499 family)
MNYKRVMITSLTVLMVLMMSAILGSRWYSAEYSRPHSIGLVKDRLTECSQSPNCVSSQTTQNAKRIAPINTNETPELAWLMLRAVVGNMSQAKLITEDERYRHYQFTSPLMGFIDDIELLFDHTNKLIHVKSASRVGKSDIGANRNRVALLSERLTVALRRDESI